MARIKEVRSDDTSKATSTSSSTSTKHRSQSPESSSDRPLGPLAVSIPASEREQVKVNNANLTELKNACDDAVKRFLARPELFKQIHLHTDVRLALGWLSVFVAAGTAFYGYKVDFETSKPVVTVGLIVYVLLLPCFNGRYILLTTLSTLYAYFIEGDTIFVGKRKTFSKRIITERITLSSTTLPARAPSSPSPQYSVSIQYVRSTNGGKSLLGRGRTKASSPYAKFFDEKGVLDQEALERREGFGTGGRKKEGGGRVMDTGSRALPLRDAVHRRTRAARVFGFGWTASSNDLT
ncbi:hypothetical protein CC1G_03586 [Coprinopsis cinerea okayama7|uniref:Signal peptidase complex subunit 2 n=1 Tax=Coprinopsis cinerea (strain Okayama-7 / 130 / ATCC MYA-4618 / FGSC 9003) TaxID=240176 RepID=A8NCM8_COPC7|nr:hypothetical protein CC1G_03586 [Coprinopsis cinerea okayama7\|eukprot:XP_001832572.2 hypothetical protein CC1G_03586 [Coprinopsis cinerea okayama7\